MAPNVNTFANQLKHFSKSVDIVDDDVFDRLRALIYKYVKAEMSAAYFELMRDHLVDGQPGLRMFWSSDDREHAWTIRENATTYRNPACQAFDLGRPVWIVSPDRKTLAEVDEYQDPYRAQSKMTGEAIQELHERLESATFPRLTKPRFFLAFSQEADPKVCAIILEVLQDHSDKLEFTDWTQMNESGDVNAQVIREITRSRFGICYLSEPAEGSTGGGRTYRDNPNVIFEAGMLTVVIPRSNTGELNQSRLHDTLDQRITRLLGGP